jgi:hypothetical protein
MRTRLVGTVMLLSLIIALRAWAGWDEGNVAYARGDYATAVREFFSLAQQGDANAQFNLGAMYTHGQGVPQDYAQALTWYRRAADQGYAIAQFNLGGMYTHGQGVPQDYAQALTWYRRAADQGDTGAQSNLGTMYANGQGVPQDYAQALTWYRRAAAQGAATGQFNLGVMYAQGQGVPQDYQQAYFWYNLAAAHLSPPEREKAISNRDNSATRLTPAQLAQAQAQARAWQPKPETPGALSYPRTSPSGPSVEDLVNAGLSSPRTLPSPPQVLPLVWRVQERLKAVGFDPGPVDGAFGPKTRDALRWFQNTKGLLPTGDLDKKTLDALGVR